MKPENDNKVFRNLGAFLFVVLIGFIVQLNFHVIPQSGLNFIANVIGGFKVKTLNKLPLGTTSVTAPPSNMLLSGSGNGHYLIDLGSPTVTTATTGWNNMYGSADHSHENFSLTDSTGASTGVNIAVSPSLWVNSDGAGTMAADANTAGTTASGPYPANAISDSVFTSTTGFAGSPTSFTYTLSGLNDADTYNITFYASRDGVADIRTSNYTIGATTVTLNAANNVNSSVTISNVTPSGGIITITQQIGTGSTNSNGFSYLGVLDIVDNSLAATKPTVTTSAATSVATTTATLNGAITSNGNEDASQSGFVYSLRSDFSCAGHLGCTVATTTLGAKVGNASLTSNIINLGMGRQYFFRAYATNSAGVGYGSNQTFTTNTVVPPTAHAGVDQTITLPTHTVTLSGLATAGDGTVNSYDWTEITSGAARILSPTSAGTVVTDLAAGTYTFELTVGATDSTSGTDDVNVTVNNSLSTAPSRKVVVLGSSTAAGYGLTDINNSWVNLFKSYFQNLNASNSVVNLAVSGYSTRDILPSGVSGHNITAALAQNPDAIIVNLPSNDTANGYTLSETEANFQTISNLANAAGIPIWIATTQPRNFVAPSDIQKQKDTRDWILSAYGSKAIDFWTTVADPTDSTIVTTYGQGDGIHLNDAGHQILYNRVAGSGLVEDMYVAPAVSAVVSSPTDTTATITWTTDEYSNSQVVFSPVSTMIASSTLDSSPVTSHSVTLTSLAPCTKYYFKARSADPSANTTYSSSGTFNTTGCTGSAPVLTESVNSITSGGGSTNLLSSGNGITLTVPAGFSGGSSAYFEIRQLDKTAFITGASVPTGQNMVANYIYHIAALPTVTSTITTFDQPLTVSIHYDDSEITGLDESALALYQYDSPTWTKLSNCSVSTSANTVTCTTTHFSDFGLFGQTSSNPSGDNNNGGGGSSNSSSSHGGGGVVRPPAQTLPTVPPVSFTFTRNLARGASGTDVLALQKYLNTHGAVISTSGNGSPGKETQVFGSLTFNALVKFQNIHAIDILIPAGLSKGSGYFGSRTRNYINNH